MDWYAVDRTVCLWVHGLELPAGPVLAVTHLATWGGLWVLVAAALLAFGKVKDRWTGVAVLTGLTAHVAIVELVLKPWVARPRPFSALGLELRDTMISAESFSFPSGHSTASFLCAWILAVRFPRWRWPLFAVAASIALSRVHLGAHYPTDVLVGAAVGCAIGAGVARGFALAPASDPGAVASGAT